VSIISDIFEKGKNKAADKFLGVGRTVCNNSGS